MGRALKKPRHLKKNKSPTSKSNPTFSQNVRSAKITHDDIRKAMEAVNNLPEDDRKNFTSRSIAMMKAFGLFNEQEEDPDEKQIAKITAVQARVTAMAKLIDSGAIKKRWTMESGKEGLTYISREVLKVAAVATLHGGEDEPSYFNGEEFLRLILEFAEQEGEA